MSDDLDILDLDADRASRAAQREGKGASLPIRFGGEKIADLPVELPLDVLLPLREIDEDLALMFRTVMQMASQQTGEASRMDATNLVVDLLVSNPNLPTVMLDTAAQIGRNLLTVEGYDKFIAQRPSREDIGALIKGVFRYYGVSLGEASAPSDSSDSGGATSNTTSSSTSDSTPEVSGPTPDAPQTPQTPTTGDGQQPMAS